MKSRFNAYVYLSFKNVVQLHKNVLKLKANERLLCP